MSSLAVIERYSRSLFQVAEANDAVEDIKNELQALAKVFTEDEKLKTFFTSPGIKSDIKANLLKETLDKGEFSRYTINYFNLLIENNRFDFNVPYLSAVTFNNFYLKSQGIKKGKIILAKELNEIELAKLTQEISEKLGFKLELKYQYDLGLIDGIYLEIEGVVYEDNLNKRLVKLEKWLKG